MDGQKDNHYDNNNSGSSANGEASHQNQNRRIETEEESSHSDQQNTAIQIEDSDEDFHDFSYRTDSPLDLIDKKDLQNNDHIPLIPTDFTSIAEALQNFTAVFESRYGAQHAQFYDGPLQKALTDAFDFPVIEERRPLALYLHHDEAVAAHIFPQTVMCSPEVSNLLKCQFSVWGWDMTQQQNRQTFYEWMNMSNLALVADSIRMVSPSKYPILVVLVKEKGQFQRSTLIYGQENKDSAVQKLMVSLDHFQQIREQEKEEERKRMEREQFRREQAEEYERSLAADRVKQQEKRRKQEKAREEEEKKQQEEHDKQQRIGVLNDILPSEPAENEPNVIKIRFRCPNGEVKERRFRPDESIEMMLIYGETIGFDREHYTFMTSDRPNKEVNKMDLSKSFAGMGWKRELITIREV